MKNLLFLLAGAMVLSAVADEVFNENKFLAEGRALEWNKKISEARDHYQKGLEKPLSPSVRRIVLNRCAMFGRSNAEKEDFLLRASMVTGADPTETYRTFLLMGLMNARKSPDKALGYFLNFGEEKKVAPALVYSGYLEAGRIVERQKKYQEALDYYRKALAAGKAVTYKFNYSAAEKAIAKVEGLLKKGDEK